MSRIKIDQFLVRQLIKGAWVTITSKGTCQEAIEFMQSFPKDVVAKVSKIRVRI